MKFLSPILFTVLVASIAHAEVAPECKVITRTRAASGACVYVSNGAFKSLSSVINDYDQQTGRNIGLTCKITCDIELALSPEFSVNGADCKAGLIETKPAENTGLCSISKSLRKDHVGESILFNGERNLSDDEWKKLNSSCEEQAKQVCAKSLEVPYFEREELKGAFCTDKECKFTTEPPKKSEVQQNIW